eukprot:767475-Hanusia_phi.AAC.2
MRTQRPRLFPATRFLWTGRTLMTLSSFLFTSFLLPLSLFPSFPPRSLVPSFLLSPPFVLFFSFSLSRRFSGHGLGKSRQTVMPGYEEQDAKELREAYEEKYRSLEPEMQQLDAEIAKEGETPELRQQKEELDNQLKEAKDAWMAAQVRVRKVGGSSAYSCAGESYPTEQGARQRQDVPLVGWRGQGK